MRILVNGIEVSCQAGDVQLVMTDREWRTMVSAALQALPIGAAAVVLPGDQRVVFRFVGVVQPAGKPHIPIL